MSLEKYSPEIRKQEPQEERLISIKKFDGKLSLYFIYNGDNKSEIKFTDQSFFTCCEKKILNFELLLEKYKIQFQNLLEELDSF